MHNLKAIFFFLGVWLAIGNCLLQWGILSRVCGCGVDKLYRRPSNSMRACSLQVALKISPTNIEPCIYSFGRHRKILNTPKRKTKRNWLRLKKVSTDNFPLTCVHTHTHPHTHTHTHTHTPSHRSWKFQCGKVANIMEIKDPCSRGT